MNHKIVRESNRYSVYNSADKIVGSHVSEKEAYQQIYQLENPNRQQFEFENDPDEPLEEILERYDFKQLDIWVDAFMQSNLTVPRPLWQAREDKLQFESIALLKALVKSHENDKRKQ